MLYDEYRTGIRTELNDLSDNFDKEYQVKKQVLIDSQELIRMRINKVPLGKLGILTDIDQGVIKFEPYDWVTVQQSDLVRAVKANYDISVTLNNTGQGLIIKQDSVFSEELIIKKRISTLADRYSHMQKDIRTRWKKRITTAQKESLLNKNEVFELISIMDDLSSALNKKIHDILKQI